VFALRDDDVIIEVLSLRTSDDLDSFRGKGRNGCETTTEGMMQALEYSEGSLPVVKEAQLV
jgi:hypothetical protein